MIICWDNLEKMIFTKGGNLRIGNRTYYEYDACIECGDVYLGQKKNIFCSNKCANTGKNNPFYNKTHTEEIRTKLSIAHTGKTLTKEHKAKIGVASTGRTHTEETRRKISILYCGENNPAWKGGISCEPYCFQWTDKEYKNWLKYERDNGKCQNPQCNGKSHRLCLHHINYNKKDCRPNNLIGICTSCNTKANTDREWHEAYYTILMKKRGVK